MIVKCPTCKKLHEYDRTSPWRPFCCERCKIIDLGAWATGAYKIAGVPGTADPDVLAEQLELLEQHAQDEAKSSK